MSEEKPLSASGPALAGRPLIPQDSGRRLRFPVAAAWLVLGALPAASGPALGQGVERECRAYLDASEPGWNEHRVLRIIREAVRERQNAFSDTTLSAFDAYAEGHIDFLADFGEFGGERTVRIDHVALQLQWARGGGSLQTLIGRRKVTWAPTKIHYHIDHLSLVMENFGETIQIGEGDEIEHVLHPIAPGAPDYYQYRLVDSTAVMVGPHTSTVYRIQVRPSCQDDPGVVGTFDLDYESLAIARMSASFTPSSYVDPTVASVTIVLVNGWVERRWWLPVRQRVEVRRQVNWMDLPFGTTIRASFEILDYDLDPEPHQGLRGEHRVGALPQDQLDRYAGWQREEMRIQGSWAPKDSARFEDVRREAVGIVANRYLGGNSRLRFFLPDLSSGIRYRRAEGLLLGAGASYRPSGHTGIFAWAGYPFERQKPQAALEIRQRLEASTVKLHGYLERLTDVGAFPTASGLISSFGAAFRGDDYTDPYFRSGGSISLMAPIGTFTATARGVWEEQKSAELVAGSIGSTEPRPVRSITDGTDLRAEFELATRLGTGLAAAWSIALRSELSGGADFGYTRWIASFEAAPPDPDAVWQWEAAGSIALATGTTPEQRLFLIGGRGTVPGYAFRTFGGDQAAYSLAAMSRELVAPWIRLRVLGAAGWSEVTMVSRRAAESFGVVGTDRIKTSLGAGVSLFWDLVRLDAAHGLDDGEWEWMLSVNPAWREPL